MMVAKMQPVDVARAYRAEHQTPPGGVVLLWGGTAYGWKNALRDAGHERPGALAVDVDGHVFQAQGGDDFLAALAFSTCWAFLDATRAYDWMRTNCP